MNSWILSLKTRPDWCFLLGILLFCSCSGQKSQSVSHRKAIPTQSGFAIQQGVYGTVLFKEGTFEKDGTQLLEGSVQAVKRKILFYELTSVKDVEIIEEDFVKFISNTWVDSVSSNEQGKFEISLPPGNYSMFVQEDDRLYSKLINNAYFMPIAVYKDSVSQTVIEIDYKAVY